MAPDILTVSARPEWRLRAALQANALVDALLAAACLARRADAAALLSLPDPAFAVALGFVFAFASAFLFRITVRDPVPRHLALVSVAGNGLTTLALAALVVFDLLKFSSAGRRVVATAAAVHACFGLIQLAFIHRAAHGYAQTEAVAV